MTKCSKTSRRGRGRGRGRTGRTQKRRRTQRGGYNNNREGIDQREYESAFGTIGGNASSSDPDLIDIVI